MNRLKSLFVLALLTAAPVLSFAQNADAWVIFPSGDHYVYDHHHDKEWNRIHERQWRERHEREVKEYEHRQHRDHHDDHHHDHDHP